MSDKFPPGNTFSVTVSNKTEVTVFKTLKDGSKEWGANPNDRFFISTDSLNAEFAKKISKGSVPLLEYPIPPKETLMGVIRVNEFYDSALVKYAELHLKKAVDNWYSIELKNIPRKMLVADVGNLDGSVDFFSLTKAKTELKLMIRVAVLAVGVKWVHKDVFSDMIEHLHGNQSTFPGAQVTVKYNGDIIPTMVLGASGSDSIAAPVFWVRLPGDKVGKTVIDNASRDLFVIPESVMNIWEAAEDSGIPVSEAMIMKSRGCC